MTRVDTWKVTAPVTVSPGATWIVPLSKSVYPAMSSKSAE